MATETKQAGILKRGRVAVTGKLCVIGNVQLAGDPIDPKGDEFEYAAIIVFDDPEKVRAISDRLGSVVEVH